MNSLVHKGQINTFVVKPVDLKSILNAKSIGVAHYKLNLLQHALDDVDLKPSDGLERVSNHFGEINRLVGTSILLGIEHKDHGAEIEQLKIKSSTLIQSGNDLYKKRNELINTKHENIQKHNEHAQKVKLLTDQRDKLIQQLKNEFGFK